jgi:hypothetical protein
VTSPAFRRGRHDTDRDHHGRAGGGQARVGDQRWDSDLLGPGADVPGLIGSPWAPGTRSRRRGMPGTSPRAPLRKARGAGGAS